MKKTFKRFFAIAMTAMMVISIVPETDFSAFITSVKAAETLPDDSEQISNLIPDLHLSNAIRLAVKGDISASVTVKDLRTFTGTIDLSQYDRYDLIESLEGLGYARKAEEIDASKLSKVKYINESEFKYCEFTTFGMPENIIEIGKDAFSGCQNLTYIKLPETLKTIQSGAFNNCKKLDGIKLPDGIEKIGNNAFAVCESLQSIVIPDDINAAAENAGEETTIGIGAGVFYGCSSLTSVTIGAGMTAIPASFLANTTKLKSIDIPTAITSIRDGAFSGSGITTIDLSQNTQIVKINNSVFNNCKYLEEVILPEGIESIEEKAFYSCSKLRDFSFVTNLSKLKIIGENAFAECGFESIVIPSEVEQIGKQAFYSCSKLISVTIEDFQVIDGDKVNSIGSYAFAECSHLEQVQLPKENEENPHVTVDIGSYAFYKCIRLNDVYFPKNLTKIGDYAFKECGLSITDWADEYDDVVGNAYLGTVYYIEPQYISDSVDSGYDEVIMYTHKYEKYYQPTTAYVDMSKAVVSESKASSDAIKIVVVKDGGDPKKDPKVHTQYYFGMENVDLSHCPNVTLGVGAFYKCQNLKKVSLPDELTAIPDLAFGECYTEIYTGAKQTVSSLWKYYSVDDIKILREYKGFSSYEDKWYISLETVEMGDNIETIGKGAFSQDKNLVINGELPSHLKKIDATAFEGCESLGEVVFPKALEYIGNSAFAKTSRLCSAYMTPNKALDIDASYAVNLAYVGNSAFAKSSIKEFVMDQNAPLNVVADSAFYDCQYLDTVVLGKKVADIKSKALGLCLRLKTVEVFDSCTFEKDSIAGGENTKGFPGALSGVYIYTIDDDAFYATNQFSLKITPVNDYISARQNKNTKLPLYTIDYDSSGYYKEVKIGDYVYEYNPDQGILDGEMDQMSTLAIPTMQKMVNTAVGNDYVKPYNTNAYGLEVFGCQEVQKIGVNIQEYLVLEIYSSGTTKVTREYFPTVTYTMDITAVPCTDIVVDENQYVSIAATANGIKIAPEFLSATGEEITEDVEWKVLTGDSYITMTVADDGKSITVKPTGTGCGNASIQVKAGKVIKTIYINVIAPCNSISISPNKNVDLMVGDTYDITATMSYSDAYAELAQNSPDKAIFTSSDENVVKVSKVVDGEGHTVCTLKAVGIGSATITAKGSAGNRTASVKVNVSSEDLKLLLNNGNGTQINSNDTVEMRTKSSSYYYEFNQTLFSNMAVVDIEDSTIAKATVSKEAKRVTFTALKAGNTKVTIYPEVGTKENGVTFILSIRVDVTNIRLASKIIAEGETASVFTFMENLLGARITEANSSSFKSISDNQIVFESSNPTYVTVDNFGNVTVKKYSDTVKNVSITCKALNSSGEVVKQASATVTLQKPAVKSVLITGSSTLYVGVTEQYNINVYPTNGNYSRMKVDVISGDVSSVVVQLSSNNAYMNITPKRTGRVVVKVSLASGFDTLASGVITINIVKVGKTSFKKPKRGKKKLTLKWKKVSGVAGYQIQKSKSSYNGFKTIKTIKSGKTVKYTVKKLKSKKTYYYRIRAYKYTSKGVKVYSDWSKVKGYKAK